MNAHYDVAIVGAGIVGLAQAWMAARRGLRVVILERTAAAQGASVRNFGMIWPVGQPAGEMYALALRSRDFWLELRHEGAMPVEDCGSMHLAHQADELAVLEEFCQQQTHDVRLLSSAEVQRMAPLANPQNLRGGLWSPTELRADPRTASAKLAAWLTARHAVECCFETPIVRIADRILQAADGRTWSADRIVICSGSDLRTLYPEILATSGLRLCKLQMLKSAPQLLSSPPAVHLASGLTLRHYESFRGCPSLAALRERIAQESPELDRFGIHVMASQFPNGEVILGDSHEYGAEISPFDKMEIDELMLRELKKVIQLSDWTICERWHGVYAKHPTLPVFEAIVDDGVQIFLGTGGAGMTMSFGLADRAWQRWTGA
ncbi:MAG: TIGR03364 family FAD-dependent oxidoreductase [Planctomycetaceae bacterium]